MKKIDEGTKFRKSNRITDYRNIINNHNALGQETVPAIDDGLTSTRVIVIGIQQTILATFESVDTSVFKFKRLSHLFEFGVDACARSESALKV
jgi:hypothetical protein